jgi:hypothetical protein
MFTLSYLFVPHHVDPSAQPAANSAIGSTYNLGAGLGAVAAGGAMLLSSLLDRSVRAPGRPSPPARGAAALRF